MKTIPAKTWCMSRYLRQSLAFLCQHPLLNTTGTSPSVVARKKHIAIVGSGPAGFYSAQQILKGDSEVKVDVYEKLPVPFGLVRFGVAPDHPEVKTARNDRFTFLGNVEIGKDLSLQVLRKAYSAVILCYGASDDRLVGIPGENYSNVLSARSLVGWYNGLPQDKKLVVDLNCESAVILGHGNVAVDVARILLTPISILEKTDITDYALEALRKSQIKKVHLVGRRGPLQVSFTIKELRELIKLSGVKPVLDPKYMYGLDSIIPDLPRPRRRLTDLLYNTAVSPTEMDQQKWAAAQKQCHIVFMHTPISIVGSDEGNVKAVRFAVNQLQGTEFESQVAVPTGEEETIDCGLVLRSIGYRSHALDKTIPFDNTKGVISNNLSRVKGEKGLYCAGWVGTGPVGVILSTMTNGFDTGKTVLQDLHSGCIPSVDPSKRDALIEELEGKYISFKGWEKIDEIEKALGEKFGKPRKKITDLNTLVTIAKG